ncbi:MAG: protein kinase [Candidatus Brocadiae bacterium]|nr:protein kinase [Candidatus Brocadiia bacterium]
MDIRQTLMEAYQAGWISLEELEKMEESILNCEDSEIFWQVLKDSVSALQFQEIQKLHGAKKEDIAVKEEDTVILQGSQIKTILDNFVGIDRIEEIKQLVAGDRYQMQETLGMGGMGIVFKAYDMVLQIPVALKVPQHIGKEHIERFLQDARSAVRIHHPHIVRIYNVSSTPYPHYSMEYIYGKNLLQILTSEKIHIPMACDIVYKIALALQEVHKQGVIHRDIKPSNIMIDSQGEPKLMDFGMAKIKESHFTTTGQILGTPQYMPPEQISSAFYSTSSAIDARSDIYSLGTTLYTLLTKKPPFEGDNLYAILRAVLEDKIIEPKKWNPHVPAELNAICLKSMEKRQEKRYSCALEMAQDIDNYLHGRPISARSLNFWEKSYQFVLLNKKIFLFGMVLSFSLILGAIVSFVQWQRAEKNLIEARHFQGRTFLEKAQGLYNSKNIFWAKILAEESLGMGKQHAFPLLKKDTAEWNHAYRMLADGLDFRFLYQIPMKGVMYSVDFSLDGRFLLLAGWDKKMYLWDLAKSKAIQEDQMSSEIYGISRHPQKEIFACVDASGHIALWNFSSWQMLQKWQREGIHSVCFSPQGKLAYADIYGQIFLRDIDTLSETIYKQGKGNINAFCFTPDGKSLLIAKEKGLLEIRDVASGNLIKSHQEESGKDIYALSIHRNGKILATGREDGVLELWNLETQKRIYSTKYCQGAIYTLAFSPNGTMLAAGNSEESITIWQFQDTALSLSLLSAFFGTHHGNIHSLSFSPDGRVLVSAGADGFIRLWATSIQEQTVLLSPDFKQEASKGILLSLALHPDGKTLVSGGSREGRAELNLWDITLGVWQGALPAMGKSIYNVKFSPDGKMLASGGHRLELWDFEKKEKIFIPCIEKAREIKTLDFTWDSKMLIFSSFENPVFFLDISEKKLYPFTESIPSVQIIRLCPKGNFLALTGQEKDIYLKNIRLPDQNMLKLSDHSARISCMNFSPDGKLLASGSYDLTIRLWDLEAKRCIAVLDGHKQVIRDIAFTQDGKILASGGSGEIQIWNLMSFKEILSFSLTSRIQSMLFCNHDKTLVSASSDMKIRLRDIEESFPRYTENLDYKCDSFLFDNDKKRDSIFYTNSLSCKAPIGSHLGLLQKVSDQENLIKSLCWQYWITGNEKAARHLVEKWPQVCDPILVKKIQSTFSEK